MSVTCQTAFPYPQTASSSTSSKTTYSSYASVNESYTRPESQSYSISANPTYTDDQGESRSTVERYLFQSDLSVTGSYLYYTTTSHHNITSFNSVTQSAVTLINSSWSLTDTAYTGTTSTTYSTTNSTGTSISIEHSIGSVRYVSYSATTSVTTTSTGTISSGVSSATLSVASNVSLARAFNTSTTTAGTYTFTEVVTGTATTSAGTDTSTTTGGTTSTTGTFSEHTTSTTTSSTTYAGKYGTATSAFTWNYWQFAGKTVQESSTTVCTVFEDYSAINEWGFIFSRNASKVFIGDAFKSTTVKTAFFISTATGYFPPSGPHTFSDSLHTYSFIINDGIDPTTSWQLIYNTWTTGYATRHVTTTDVLSKTVSGVTTQSYWPYTSTGTTLLTYATWTTATQSTARGRTTIFTQIILGSSTITETFNWGVLTAKSIPASGQYHDTIVATMLDSFTQSVVSTNGLSELVTLTLTNTSTFTNIVWHSSFEYVTKCTGTYYTLDDGMGHSSASSSFSSERTFGNTGTSDYTPPTSWTVGSAAVGYTQPVGAQGIRFPGEANLTSPAFLILAATISGSSRIPMPFTFTQQRDGILLPITYGTGTTTWASSLSESWTYSFSSNSVSLTVSSSASAFSYTTSTTQTVATTTSTAASTETATTQTSANTTTVSASFTLSSAQTIASNYRTAAATTGNRLIVGGYADVPTQKDAALLGTSPVFLTSRNSTGGETTTTTTISSLQAAASQLVVAELPTSFAAGAGTDHIIISKWTY